MGLSPNLSRTFRSVTLFYFSTHPFPAISVKHVCSYTSGFKTPVVVFGLSLYIYCILRLGGYFMDFLSILLLTRDSFNGSSHLLTPVSALFTVFRSLGGLVLIFILKFFENLVFSTVLSRTCVIIILYVFLFLHGGFSRSGRPTYT